MVCGFEVAPRAWHKKLHMVLPEWALKQLYADEQIYFSHDAEKKLNCI